MAKQNIKSFDYFEKYLNDNQNYINAWFFDLDSGKVSTERLPYFKNSLLTLLLNYAIAGYTSGLDNDSVLLEFEKVISYLDEGWPKKHLNLISGSLKFYQYDLTSYDKMLWILSLGYLLEIPSEQFEKIVEVIDRDEVKDDLFEFIIRAKLPNRPPIIEESYKKYFGVPQIFSKLRQAIAETDKTKAEKLVKEFVCKDWYKNHKDAGWYNNHKSHHNVYYGYWSFETAAIVKIMSLDDSNFKDCPYYPKDLVHET